MRTIETIKAEQREERFPSAALASAQRAAQERCERTSAESQVMRTLAALAKRDDYLNLSDEPWAFAVVAREPRPDRSDERLDGSQRGRAPARSVEQRSCVVAPARGSRFVQVPLAALDACDRTQAPRPLDDAAADAAARLAEEERYAASRAALRSAREALALAQEEEADPEALRALRVALRRAEALALAAEERYASALAQRFAPLVALDAEERSAAQERSREQERTSHALAREARAATTREEAAKRAAEPRALVARVVARRARVAANVAALRRREREREIVRALDARFPSAAAQRCALRVEPRDARDASALAGALASASDAGKVKAGADA